MKDLAVALLKRLPILAILLGMMVWTLFQASKGGMGGVIGASFIILGLFIVSCTIIAPPIAAFLAEPFAELYMPKGEVIPPPLYYLVEKYESEGRFDEALAEYQKILRYHPQDYPAHEGRMRLAVHGLRDVDLARNYFRESCSHLKDPQAVKDLEAAWRTMFPLGLV